MVGVLIREDSRLISMLMSITDYGLRRSFEVCSFYKILAVLFYFVNTEFVYNTKLLSFMHMLCSTIKCLSIVYVFPSFQKPQPFLVNDQLHLFMNIVFPPK